MANPDHLGILRPYLHLPNADLSGADLAGLNLSGVILNAADLTNANLAGADLTNAVLTGADLTSATLRNANLFNATLTHGRLNGASLVGANLVNADLKAAQLAGADLTAAVLRNANMADAFLERAQFMGASMRGVRLTRAFMAGASLHYVNASEAIFNEARLDDATVNGTNLSDASFVDADLSHASLRDADLSRADLTGARLAETLFADIDLRTTIGLDSCVHDGPSPLDYRTLLRSGRSIPLSFLRGCGLPDDLINYLPALVAQPIQFYSCFISYATANQDFAERIHADLQAKGIRCWFAPHDMQPGRKVHEQIDEAIRVYDRLLLILSHASMSSAWVKTEIARARRKEVSLKRRVLFPLSLVPFSEVRSWEQFNADLGEDTAREIREYYVPDFSQWKTDHAFYQREFAKVVAALKGDAPPSHPPITSA